MWTTALLCILTYFIPFFIYLILELSSDRVHIYRGDEYSFRDYIIEVLLVAISSSLHLAANLLQDLTQPLLLYLDTENQPIWLQMLLLGQQVGTHLLCNLATVLYFIPLEALGTLLQGLRRRHSV